MPSSRKNFASQQPSEDLMVLEFSQLGFIGKMFKSPDRSLTVEFISMLYPKPTNRLLALILVLSGSSSAAGALTTSDKPFSGCVEVLPLHRFQPD
ncbi:hypothetical protein QTO34_014468 [Cnephaeus nilssonii]|uniref:MGAT4 conserved region domain-containing protein n=1 Tax=Cnephaeus nilssonii TaxID=3371016 RepID=A0AA40I6E6_CNENI|nr:hypothetical protein QTO34_014468 [Eptesicus nilssonii]